LYSSWVRLRHAGSIVLASVYLAFTTQTHHTLSHVLARAVACIQHVIARMGRASGRVGVLRP
jgi:hypothetical protein